MLEIYSSHNRFKTSFEEFIRYDPHLSSLAKLKYQHHTCWWQELSLDIPGIYILTGGRQVGKSTSCKQLIKYALENQYFTNTQIYYIACDEIYDAKDLSKILRLIVGDFGVGNFLLVIDEITFVKNWDRVIKAMADEGLFENIICILTGSDSLIQKEATQRFPGRRGLAPRVDFHLYPLSFKEFVALKQQQNCSLEQLYKLFNEYLISGGYLRAINDLAQHGKILDATFITRTVCRYLKDNANFAVQLKEANLIESIVASHCKRVARSFYYKGLGEIDVIMMQENQIQAIEVKWSNQIRSADLKLLKEFPESVILHKQPTVGNIDHIASKAVYYYLANDL
jgi:predicted AAA+ superfamily ATPase